MFYLILWLIKKSANVQSKISNMCIMKEHITTIISLHTPSISIFIQYLILYTLVRYSIQHIPRKQHFTLPKIQRFQRLTSGLCFYIEKIKLYYENAHKRDDQIQISNILPIICFYYYYMQTEKKTLKPEKNITHHHHPPQNKITFFRKFSRILCVQAGIHNIHKIEYTMQGK